METKNTPNADHGCLGKALIDEPMFILLGRDPAAPAAIRRWAKSRRKFRPDEEEQTAQAERDAEDFEAWRVEHDGEWRDPEAERGAVLIPSDEISSLAGRIMSPEYGVTSMVVVQELIEKIAAANSAGEAVEAAKAVLGPYEDSAQRLAGFVLRADRTAGSNV